MKDSKPLRIVHFADAHIDMTNYGRHDPDSALPIRVVDYLKALDQIIDAAVEEKVDLVLFAGDAYKDRNPQPTFQREWGRRMMRLSEAEIPTVLLVGNHDVSPASGRAHTLHEFNTLKVPYIHVADDIRLVGPDVLGIPLQIITLPWVSRSKLMNREETVGKRIDEILLMLEELVTNRVETLIKKADPDIPLILTAHASVHGAKYGSERQVMLGHELVLSHKLVSDKRLDYVALGHIHKHQSLNGDTNPPIVYPGSIERVDFGEKEKKGFVIAEIKKRETSWQFIRLETRRFVNKPGIEPQDSDTFMADIMSQLPLPEEVEDAICRITLKYPRDWEPLLDEKQILTHLKSALDVKIVKEYVIQDRARLGDTVALKTMSPLDLLEKYWATKGFEPDQAEALQSLAKEILNDI